MTDTVFVHELAAEGIIGVAPWERQVRQKLVLDITLETGLAAAGQSDSLDDAIDYAAVSERVRALVGAAGFHLIEALAEAIAADLLAHWPVVRRARVSITKPGAVAGTAGAGVSIEREAG